MRPVMNVARFDMQVEEATWKRENQLPACASESMCGVLTMRLPAYPT